MIVNKAAFMKRMEKRILEKAPQNAKRACQRSADLVRNKSIDSISRGSPSGETYEKYNPRRTHVASAPGQPPATDTGFLVSSIYSEVGVDRGDIVGMVRASAPYAIFLEFGTMNMAARPFFEPALMSERKKIKAIFMQEGVIS
jgi:HK97 gp10 family phage protein